MGSGGVRPLADADVGPCILQEQRSFTLIYFFVTVSSEGRGKDRLVLGNLLEQDQKFCQDTP